MANIYMPTSINVNKIGTLIWAVGNKNQSSFQKKNKKKHLFGLGRPQK